MNTTETKQTAKMIEWGNKKEVVNQVTTVSELRELKLIEKIANNFGYAGVESQYARLDKGNYFKFYVVKADPKFNYGMDFELWGYYTADEGMLFMRKIEFGGSITSRPLSRVKLNTTTPAICDKMIDVCVNESKENLKIWFDNNKTEWHKGVAIETENKKNNVIDSFEFSTNIGYKKDQEFRPELRQFSKDYGFIYCSL